MKGIPTGRAWLAACAGALALAACGGNGDKDGYVATILVADTAAMTNPYGGSSAHVDANLVNAWGIAFNPQGFVWVANAETSTSTLYDGNGVPQSLVVTFPDSAAGEFEPTGIVLQFHAKLSGHAGRRHRGQRLRLRRRGRGDRGLVADGRRHARRHRRRPLRGGRDLQGPRARDPGRRRFPLRDRTSTTASSTSSMRTSTRSRWRRARSPTPTCPRAMRRSASRRSATSST
jgi:hypothetical protein